jgi:hypothetical protein
VEELKMLMKKENLDVTFMVETDSISIKKPEDYQIEGYKTVLPLGGTNEKVRVMGMIKNQLCIEMKVREDLMSTEFPSIWIEIERKNVKNILICGFYREWTRTSTGSRTDREQIENLQVLTEQMTRAKEESKEVLMMGDANLDSLKWESSEYRHYKIAIEMRSSLAQNGMTNMYVGSTFVSDKTDDNGMIAESALDHVYVSQGLEKNIEVHKTELSSTDHVPVITTVKQGIKMGEKAMKMYKRNMKEFSQPKWNNTLAGKEWERIAETGDVNKMAITFNELVKESLDICAPMKSFTIRRNFRSGISEETKKLIKERDTTRRKQNDIPENKHIQHQKYKTLRNRVTNAIRKDELEFNTKRIEEAGSENEVWKIVKEVTNPTQDQKWMLKEGENEIIKEDQIAEVFNEYFINKIEDIKENVDKEYMEDPLKRLKAKMENKNLKFKLRKVSEKTVGKAMKQMSKKKSSGMDGLSQDKMIMASAVLKVPLTWIINNSIETGMFPEEWKEAVVTPILKKGDRSRKENYRPVSCLPVAS